MLIDNISVYFKLLTTDKRGVLWKIKLEQQIPRFRRYGALWIIKLEQQITNARSCVYRNARTVEFEVYGLVRIGICQR